jgi:hypothetical protein
MLGMVATAVLFFGIRAGARGTPSTMNREYQEATDAYLKVRASTKPHKAVQQPNHHNYRRTTSSPSPVSLPRTTRVASQSRVPPRPRSKRCPFQSKGLVYCIHEGEPTIRMCASRYKHARRSLYFIRLDERKGYSFRLLFFLERPLFRSHTTKKKDPPCTSLFLYLFQRTCTKITFIPFVRTLIARSRSFAATVLCFRVLNSLFLTRLGAQHITISIEKKDRGRYTDVWFTGRPLSERAPAKQYPVHIQRKVTCLWTSRSYPTFRIQSLVGCPLIRNRMLLRVLFQLAKKR